MALRFNLNSEFLERDLLKNLILGSLNPTTEMPYMDNLVLTAEI